MPLDPEIRAYLNEAAARGGKPRAEMTVEETRESYRRSSAAAAERWDLPLIEEMVVGDVPVRVYSTGDGEAEPVLVYLHGGRFFSGDLETHDGACRALAAHSGWRVASVEYRLAPEHRFPAALEDALRATEWFLERGLETGIGGDSAGGSLAAAAALSLRDRGLPLACQLLIYPMLDAACALPSHSSHPAGLGPSSQDMKRGYAEYLPPGADLTDPRVSPFHAPDLAGLPPSFVLVAEFDSLRDEGEQFAARLQAAGLPLEVSLLEGAIHGVFTMGGLLAAGREATRRAGLWLRGLP